MNILNNFRGKIFYKTRSKCWISR